MVEKSLAPNTLITYQRGISSSKEFRCKSGLSDEWPIPVDHILQFIVFLLQENLSHSTILCYIAGIRFYSKVNGYDDTSQLFVVKKVLEGIKRSKGSTKDNRLPITKDLLKVILNVVPVACSSQYEACMFSTAFSLAFHGLLRVSEIAASNGLKGNVLSFNDISLSNGKPKVLDIRQVQKTVLTTLG